MFQYVRQWCKHRSFALPGLIVLHANSISLSTEHSQLLREHCKHLVEPVSRLSSRVLWFSRRLQMFLLTYLLLGAFRLLRGAKYSQPACVRLRFKVGFQLLRTLPVVFDAPCLCAYTHSVECSFSLCVCLCASLSVSLYACLLHILNCGDSALRR